MTRLDDTYGPEFYAETVALRHQYDALANAIHCVIPSGSVLDLGCGAGLVLAKLQWLGHAVKGVEGSIHGRNAAPDEIRDRIVVRDLFDDAFLQPFKDTLICTEVAEHVPPEQSGALVNLCCLLAEHAIVWSAAPPGQGGVDHVNEQPPSYWLEKFAALGWVPDMLKTSALRILMRQWSAQHNGCAANFHVLVPS